MNRLSDRLRPDVEAAMWVIDEVWKLEEEIERMRAEREQAWNAAIEAAEKVCRNEHAACCTNHAARAVEKCLDAIRALRDVK